MPVDWQYDAKRKAVLHQAYPGFMSGTVDGPAKFCITKRMVETL